MEYAFFPFLVLFFLLLEGFFSGTEIAFISISPAHFRRLAIEGDPSAILVERIGKRPEEVFATTSFGTNFSVVCSSALLTAFFIKGLGFTSYGDICAALILVPLTLFFGEIIPKVYLQQMANVSMPILVYPLLFFMKIFSPLVRFVGIFPKIMLKRIEVSDEKSYTREELRKVLSAVSAEEMTFESEEREMISNIISLHEIRAREIMVPLVNIVALNIQTADIKAALQTGQKSNFSRIPVFQNRIHNIVGYLNCLELIHVTELSLSIRDYVKPAYYTPESKRIDELLTEMQIQGVHTAFVVDEHGGITGLVTVEDILEEIVGEIADEHDVEEGHTWEEIAEGAYRIDGVTEIYLLNNALSLNIPEESGEYETLGGFLLDHFQKVPERGDKATIGGVRYEILDADPRKIYSVRAEIIPQTTKEEKKAPKPEEAEAAPESDEDQPSSFN